MKPIVAQDQAKLSLTRCVRLAVSGMSYRLLRSGITTAILALAVAFLVHVLTHAILAERVQRSAWESLEPQRVANAWLSHLTTPSDAATVRQENAAALQHEDRIRQYNRWLDRPMITAGPPLPFSSWIVEFEHWCEQLDPAAASVLLGGLPAVEALELLVHDEEKRQRFIAQRQDLNLESPIGNSQAWGVLIDGWEPHIQTLQKLREKHTEAIRDFGAMDARSVLTRLADPDSPTRKQLADTGFVISQNDFDRVQSIAQYLAALNTIQQSLLEPSTAAKIARQTGTSDLGELLEYAAQGRITDQNALKTLGFSIMDIENLATRYLHERRLASVVEGYEPSSRNTPFGLPVGTLWLVGLSLLVCVVGVTNALLMSVTERFNEIATMKCLGAMNRSIMQMFVAEAVIQGVLGGVVGVALGLLLTLLRGLAEFGTLFVRGLEGGADLLGAAGLSLGIGILLAALAAIGPSWIASRLAPMEAMRVE